MPFGVFTVLLRLRMLPEVRAHAGARLPDWISVGSLLAAITLLIFGTVQGPVWGWGNPRVIALLVGAVLAAALTARRAFSQPHAVI